MAAASWAVRCARRHDQSPAPIIVLAICLGIDICLGIGAMPSQMATAACGGMLHQSCERACAGLAAEAAVVAADQRCVPKVAI